MRNLYYHAGLDLQKMKQDALSLAQGNSRNAPQDVVLHHHCHSYEGNDCNEECEIFKSGGEHVYTPTTFGETANTLSCHQMGGLRTQGNESIRPADMGVFQAEHLLQAGYVIVYDKEKAESILSSRR